MSFYMDFFCDYINCAIILCVYYKLFNFNSIFFFDIQKYVYFYLTNKCLKIKMLVFRYLNKN